MNGEQLEKAMPAGSKVFLPNQAERKRRVETRLLEVFARWGFRQIVTPSFDLYEPAAGGQVRDAQTFRLVDRETGTRWSGLTDRARSMRVFDSS